MSLRAHASLSALLLVVMAAYGCASDPKGGGGGNGDDDDDSANTCPEGETLDPETETCTAETATSTGEEIGNGDGTASSVEFKVVYTAKDPTTALVDLSFARQDPTQLWVIGYGDDVVHLGEGVSAKGNGKWEEYYDPAAMHFMHKPPAFAMGDGPFWGICGDNDNAQNDPNQQPNYFMGPAMFTSDLEVFAKPTSGGLGSHYDMLHNTSMCRGIAWQEKNIYWVFNGELGAIEKYNFNKDHGPGEDDHSDGEIYRYAAGEVKGVDGVSSHVFYDPSDKFLYIADTGNHRIAKLDTTKGTQGARLPRRNEALKKSAIMEDTTVEDVVPEGTLEEPSGIEVRNGLIYVTDAATSMFHVFDKSGKEVRKLETDLPKHSLSGFTFGPSGNSFGPKDKIWFTDRDGGHVFRIDLRFEQ